MNPYQIMVISIITNPHFKTIMTGRKYQNWRQKVEKLNFVEKWLITLQTNLIWQYTITFNLNILCSTEGKAYLDIKCNQDCLTFIVGWYIMKVTIIAYFHDTWHNFVSTAKYLLHIFVIDFRFKFRIVCIRGCRSPTNSPTVTTT